jgi:hypothetical protein
LDVLLIKGSQSGRGWWGPRTIDEVWPHQIKNSRKMNRLSSAASVEDVGEECSWSRPSSGILKHGGEKKSSGHSVRVRPYSADDSALVGRHPNAGELSPQAHERGAPGRIDMSEFDDDAENISPPRPQSSPLLMKGWNASDGTSRRGGGREESFLPRKRDVESEDEDCMPGSISEMQSTTHGQPEEAGEESSMYADVDNVQQLLKSESRRSTLRLHSMLSNASRKWIKPTADPRTLPRPALPLPPAPPKTSKVLGAEMSRRSGWKSGHSSRVLLAETPGFGVSARQGLDDYRTSTAAAHISPGEYTLPPTFPRLGTTLAVFSRNFLPQRAVALQDMVHLCLGTTQSTRSKIMMVKQSMSHECREVTSQFRMLTAEESIVGSRGKAGASRMQEGGGGGGRVGDKTGHSHSDREDTQKRCFEGLSKKEVSLMDFQREGKAKLRRYEAKEEERFKYTWEGSGLRRTDPPFCVPYTARYSEGLGDENPYQELSYKAGVGTSDPLSKMVRTRNLRKGKMNFTHRYSAEHEFTSKEEQKEKREEREERERKAESHSRFGGGGGVSGSWKGGGDIKSWDRVRNASPQVGISGFFCFVGGGHHRVQMLLYMRPRTAVYVSSCCLFVCWRVGGQPACVRVCMCVCVRVCGCVCVGWPPTHTHTHTHTHIHTRTNAHIHTKNGYKTVAHTV